MVDSSIRVAIWGDSFALAAVEAVLRQMAHLDVFTCSEVEIETGLLTKKVDVVLFDQNATSWRSRDLLERLRPDLPLVGLDFGGTQMVAQLSRSRNMSIEAFGQFVEEVALLAAGVSAEMGERQSNIET